jgi:hypothetical protein
LVRAERCGTERDQDYDTTSTAPSTGTPTTLFPAEQYSSDCSNAADGTQLRLDRAEQQDRCDVAGRWNEPGGSGQDRLTGSRAGADIEFALMPGDDAVSTRVAIAVRARLSGPLAQFSRAGIVEDVARRRIRTFAENIEHQLSGRAISRDRRAGPASLNIGSLLFLAWRARVRGWIARLLGWTEA